jgi:hypothetical protein
MKLAVLLVAVLLSAAGCNAPSEPSTPPPKAAVVDPNVPKDLYGAGSISGRVLFKGTAPKPVVIHMSADAYCQGAHGDTVTSDEVLLNPDGTLRNVFVYVKKGVNGAYTTPAAPAVIEQNGCEYRPHVQGLLVGQPVLIRNSDDTTHNIHALTELNEPFNIGQPVRGMESKKIFTRPEVMIHFKCDVHPWMNCYAGVLTHPFYAVTGTDGAFKLAKLPAGAYVVEAWHEKFGVQQQTVTLGQSEDRIIEFTLAN